MGVSFLRRAKTNLALWDVSSGKEVRHFAGHKVPIFRLAFSQDGKFAVSGSKIGADVRSELKVWDVATGKERKDFAREPLLPRALAFSPDSRFVLSGYWGPGLWGSVATLWDVNNGRALRTFPIGWLDDKKYINEANAAAFSPDGRFVVSGSGFCRVKHGEMKLYEVATGNNILVLFAG